MTLCLSPMRFFEKGRDRERAAGVAGGDIHKCHDVVPWGATVKGLVRRSVPVSWSKAFLRLHRCPCVDMVVGNCAVRSLERSRSALTGSPSAGSAARVCIEDSFLMALPCFEDSFSISGQNRSHAMSWSDNLMACGNSLAAASKQI